jgi:redox-regulated HSP33 family molecular chaperone
MGSEEADNGAEDGERGPFTCDFCGQRVPRVRRVALDRGYERLQTPHEVRFACERCSDEKEQRRLGLRRV